VPEAPLVALHGGEIGSEPYFDHVVARAGTQLFDHFRRNRWQRHLLQQDPGLTALQPGDLEKVVDQQV
jgi:hypothetical protein